MRNEQIASGEVTKEKKDFFTNYIQALNEIESPKLVENPNFNSKYAPLGEVIRVVKNAFTPYGLSFEQEVETVVQVINNTPITGVKVQTKVVSASGYERHFKPFVMWSHNSSPHAMGSTITYARRYNLSSIVGIIVEEDDDGNSGTGKPSQQPVSQPQNQPQQNSGKKVQQNKKPQQATGQIAQANQGLTRGQFTLVLKEEKSGKSGSKAVQLTVMESSSPLFLRDEKMVEANKINIGDVFEANIIEQNGFYFVQDITLLQNVG